MKPRKCKAVDRVLSILSDGGWHTFDACRIDSSDFNRGSPLEKMLASGELERKKDYRMTRAGRLGLVNVLRRGTRPTTSL